MHLPEQFEPEREAPGGRASIYTCQAYGQTRQGYGQAPQGGIPGTAAVHPAVAASWRALRRPQWVSRGGILLGNVIGGIFAGDASAAEAPIEEPMDDEVSYDDAGYDGGDGE